MTAALAPQQIADLLESTCALLDAELRALGDENASWHPAPGEWCANEVVGHIIEAEKRGFAGRIREVLEGKRTVAWDQVAVARERNDCTRVGQSLWMEFMGLRHASIELVRSLGPGDLDKSVVHPRVGTLRTGDLLHEWLHHDRNHAKQFLSIVQERVWPHMGNAQKFSRE